MAPHRLKDLFEPRSSWGLLGGYIVVAWAALQFTETLASLVGLPLWFGKAVLALLGLGFLVVLMTALVQGGRRGGPGEAEGRPDGLRRVFSWRHALVAGVLGFAVIGVGSAGHMAARTLGVGPVGTLMARGVLEEDAELVLADLEDHAGDPGAARALTRAFRVHLSQSPTVKLVAPARVAGALQRMEADPAAPLDLATAREVAIREGLKGVVHGEIHRLGSRYTVAVRVVAAASGEELATALESADGPDGLIPAVERLSLRLRERIGESLASVRRSPPLSRVRTASLEALESYTQALEANATGDFERCVVLMNQSIASDSAFAMAYVGRAGCNQNLGRDPALQMTDRIRAYEMRDRMTEEERLRFTAIYHQFVTEDRNQAVAAWEAFAARYPEEVSALFALANLYAESRDWARAEETLLEGLERDPSRVVALINLAGYQSNQGRFTDADSTLRRLQRAAPALDVSWWRATLRLARSDWDGAESELARMRDGVRGDPSQRARYAVTRGLMAQTLGRLAEAERLFREAVDAELEAGASEMYHLRSLVLAGFHLDARADTAAAIAVVDQALRTRPLDALDPLERPLLELAGLMAEAGRTERARELLGRWEREVAPLVPGSTVPHWLRADLAEAEGDWKTVIEEWRLEDDTREDPLPALASIGRAHDRLGQADSAIAYYRRYLDTPSRLRYISDATWRGTVLQRLAWLHEERGEHDDAARFHAELLDLWGGADPELQSVVTSARDRLQSLVGEG